MTADLEAVRAFEHAGWEKAAADYQATFAAATPPSGGALGSQAAVLHLLVEAGFGEASAETVRREWRLAQPGDLIAALRRRTVRTAALIQSQSPASMPAIAAEIARQVDAYRRDGWYWVPVVAILGRGVRPR